MAEFESTASAGGARGGPIGWRGRSEPPEGDAAFGPGTLILNRYRVEAVLGRGGMGLVYRCYDQIGRIDIALKVIPPAQARNPDEMERVRENFRLVECLHHPNIAAAKTLEHDPETGGTYLVMEYVDGVTLREYQKRHGPRMTVAAVLPLIRQVAAALDFAHSQKVVHRDIKPSNVMVTSRGEVKVLDLGLASQIHTTFSREHPQTRYDTSGTGPYMAPEQWRGELQDAATDQYALGVMAYELLTGRPPFESSDMQVLREAVLNTPPTRTPELSRTVWRTLQIALAKRREDRFENCSALVAALGGRCGRSLPAGRGARPVAWGAGALVMLGLLAALGYPRWRQAGAAARAGTASGRIIFVDDTATGKNSGTGWAHAHTSLQAAFAAAASGDQIWVAAGTYTPTTNASRSATFSLRAGVRYYGGFAGTESDLSQREFRTHLSILSGDIMTPDVNTDNSLRVVSANNARGAVLDGFTITKGYNADRARATSYGVGMRIDFAPITVRNCIFEGNYGAAGAGLHNEADALIANCIFRNNRAMARGGGFQNYFASPTLVNCLFYDNLCDGAGAALSLYHREAHVYHCTFSDNIAANGANALYLSNGGSADIQNCIFWDAGPNGGIFVKAETGPNAKASVHLAYSAIREGITLLPEEGSVRNSIRAGPRFVDPESRNFRLHPTSPCRDTGIVLTNVTDDLDGNARPVGGGYDMGAFECQSEP